MVDALKRLRNRNLTERRTEELRRTERTEAPKRIQAVAEDGVAARSAREPAARRPTAEASRLANLRHTADSGAGVRASQLQAMVPSKEPRPEDSPLRDSRPAGEPFRQLTEAQMTELAGKVNNTGDRSLFNGADNYRQTLTPELQQEYDRQLENLRNDDRVQFIYEDGAKQNTAVEEYSLRGVLAATFPSEQALDQTLDAASDPDGKFQIHVHDGPVPIGQYYDGGSTDTAAGLGLPEGGIAIDQNFLFSKGAEGDNAFVHEFSHVQQQRRTDEGGFIGEDLPADYPDPERFREAYNEDGFQDYLNQRFGDGSREPGEITGDNLESYPTVSNLFRQYPEELRENSPELYRQMVEYSGYDPIERETGPVVRLNGEGSLDQATPELSRDFERFSGGDRYVSEDDLRDVLTSDDPAVTREQRAAAAYLLSSPTARHLLDTGANRGRVDDQISERDVREAPSRYEDFADPPPVTAVRDREDAERVLEHYERLADTAAGRGRVDGNVSDDDLRAIIADPGAPPLLVEAARVLLD